MKYKWIARVSMFVFAFTVGLFLWLWFGRGEYILSLIFVIPMFVFAILTGIAFAEWHHWKDNNTIRAKRRG